MSLPLFQVDAFTDRAFGGNPAAVCLLQESREPAWMQQVAAEMNLAETAFVRLDGDPFGLRWFTPAVEVDLCGHATLAAAHVLWEAGLLPPETAARFQSASGLLTARRSDGWIELDFPATPAAPAAAPEALIEALAIEPRFVGRSRFDYLVETEEEDAVRGLRPDLALLRGLGVRGVIVTAPSLAPEVDFVSRFFAPGAGIDEDPVTGSAHCCLTPFWSARLGKPSLMARQVSARGGLLKVSLAGDRVLIAGHAVTVVRGELVA
jgi:PhzF family phenazine biosynthesis protein